MDFIFCAGVGGWSDSWKGNCVNCSCGIKVGKLFAVSRERLRSCEKWLSGAETGHEGEVEIPGTGCSLGTGIKSCLYFSNFCEKKCFSENLNM